jgi:hypothetical protein
LISVICPTVTGREELLAKTKIAYAAHTDDYELIVVPDKPACGPAWVEGASKAQGEFLHFTADDIEPHAGWWQAAVETVERGYLPAPRILNTDGSLQSCGEWGKEQDTGTQTEFSRIPFLSRAQWDVVAPLVTPFLSKTHYYTDNCISFVARASGGETGVHRDYLFTHHLAEQSRGAGMTWEQRMNHDGQLFAAFAGYVQAWASHR